MASSHGSLHVAVFGAGAFGGWTALELLHRGVRVTLIDAWGPGNARASSGGETRMIRTIYGSHDVYTEMAAQALELWRRYERAWERTFLKRTGVLWMFGPSTDERFDRTSADTLRARRLDVEPLSPGDAARRYPQIAFDGIVRVLFEPEAGYLLARRACEHVVERFSAEGGSYRVGAAAGPVAASGMPLGSVTLTNAERVEADRFVFACGPWLGRLFPDAIGDLIAPTRQDVYYFGTPPGDDRFSDDRLPAWVDFDERLTYGIPGNANRGFKIADDTPGAPFDPTHGGRDIETSGVIAAREFLARRFPALGGAPLVGSEVCQYESTPDSHFIVDRHPGASNLWIAGGGSGHGYKMGPVIGHSLAACVLDEALPNPLFSLARFSNRPPGGWEKKWS